jgi:hypothetical protein
LDLVDAHPSRAASARTSVCNPLSKKVAMISP